MGTHIGFNDTQYGFFSSLPSGRMQDRSSRPPRRPRLGRYGHPLPPPQHLGAEYEVVAPRG